MSLRGGLGGDQSDTSSTHSWTFDNGGVTLDVPNPLSLHVGCGSYSMKLHVLTPNNKSGSQDFTVEL